MTSYRVGDIVYVKWFLEDPNNSLAIITKDYREAGIFDMYDIYVFEKKKYCAFVHQQWFLKKVNE